MEYGITQSYVDFVGNRTLAPAAEQELAYCWDIHYKRAKLHNIIIAVNTSNRFSFMVYGLTKKQLWDVDDVMYRAIARMMRLTGYTDAQVEHYFDLAGRAAITTTHGEQAVQQLREVVDYEAHTSLPFEASAKLQLGISARLNQVAGPACGLPEQAQVQPLEAFKADMQRLGVL